MPINREKNGTNPELIMQLQSYLKILYRLGSENITGLIDAKRFQLQKLHNHFIDNRKKSAPSSTFRSYGDKDNEKEMIAWEKTQPSKTFNLVKRPDGVRGVLIKFSDTSSNWITLPEGLSDAEIDNFFQHIVGQTILEEVLYGKDDRHHVEELTAKQIQSHIDWIIDSF